ncbi:MAG TPA: pyridoxal-phosphate dependent enzyme [Balneolaceae bacterium]
MNFKKVCLYCGQSVDSLSYSCNCKSDHWVRQYRAMDLDIDIENIRDSITASFNAYSFNHPAGMLQYYGLPFQHFAPKDIETVGLTPLYELNRLGEQYGCRAFLKNEGNNPSGCFKDRETMMCFLNSKSKGIKNAVIYSSGNAAASAASFAENTEQQLITFVSGDTYPEKIDYIRDHGSDVVVIGDKETPFETGYRLYSQINASELFSKSRFDDWSVRNPFRVQGDKTISVEITKQLFSTDENLAPDFVLVPTANGSCLAGIWKGFKELKETGIITKLPRMISVGIKNANPVYEAVQQRQTERPVRCDLSKVDAEDAEVGSIILAEEGYDSIQAAKAVIESNGIAVGLHQSDIQKALVDFLNLEGELAVKHEILPEPAALTSIAAIKKVKEQIPVSPADILVSISTGHGLKAEKVISSLLSQRTDLQEKVQKIVAKRENHMRDASGEQGRKVRVEANLEAVTDAFFQLQKLPA